MEVELGFGFRIILGEAKVEDVERGAGAKGWGRIVAAIARVWLPGRGPDRPCPIDTDGDGIIDVNVRLSLESGPDSEACPIASVDGISSFSSLELAIDFRYRDRGGVDRISDLSVVINPETETDLSV